MTLLLLFNGADTPLDTHQQVSAQLLDYDGTPVGGDPLANAFGIMFYDEWNGPGTGSCSLSLSEAGSAELLPGRYINCLVDGTPRFTFMIEGNPQYLVIQQGEEHDQIMVVNGRGWGALFDTTTIYPEYSLTFSMDTTWRLFSFASALFPNAGDWGAAVEQAEYLEGVTTAACYGHQQMAPDGLVYPAPIGWPWGTNPFNLEAGVPTANYVEQYWLRTADQPSYVSTGYYFFRNEFTLADFTAVTFTCTGDNFFTLFLEGVPILGETAANADQWMWMGWKEHQMYLPAGTYTIAAVVYNISFTDLGGGPVDQPACPSEGFAGGPRDDNPGGLLCAIYVNGDTVTPPTYILTSDATWVSHYEEEFWPGWTPGQIVQELIDESSARGALSVLSALHSWSATVDDENQVWRPFDVGYDRADIPTIAFEVGSTIMAALTQMQQQGWINWHVTPGTLTLELFRGRSPSSPFSSATLTPGVNLLAYERNATAPYANALVVQWSGGYVVVEDAAAIIAFGNRIEDVYSSDAASEDEAILQGENELTIRAQSAFPAIIAAIEPTGADDSPYVAFSTGDYVTGPAVGGGTEVVRCLSIRCEQDELGYASWTSELNAKLDVPERRRLQLMQQIGGRNQVVRGVVT